MARTTRITRWGNNLGLRLPTAVAGQVGVDAGDTVEVSVENGAIVIRPPRGRCSLGELVGRITARNRHSETEWVTGVGREEW